ALCMQYDLTSAPPQDLIEKVVAHFGQIDVLVNNAGLVGATPLDAYEADIALAIMQLNALIPLGLIAAATPHMKPGASIVNITSINTRMPPSDAVAYAASKSALETITRGCAKSLGPKGIRVNAVSPGIVERPHAPRLQSVLDQVTDDSALGRLAEMSDIAATVRFLASDGARAITGETLTVSAGYRL
ncbi:MAG: SDR family oxidoreductase, partial [Albidovulum sp.]